MELCGERSRDGDKLLDGGRKQKDHSLDRCKQNGSFLCLSVTHHWLSLVTLMDDVDIDIY